VETNSSCWHKIFYCYRDAWRSIWRPWSIKWRRLYKNKGKCTWVKCRTRR